MPLVVIEGPHKSGKTTMARALQDWLTSNTDFNVDYRHHGLGDSTEDAINRDIADIVTCRSNTVFIFDRWYLSEYVYSALEQRASTMTAKFREFDQFVDAVTGSFAIKLVLDTRADVLKMRYKVSDAPRDTISERQAYMLRVMNTNWRVVSANCEPPVIAASVIGKAYLNT